MIENREHLWTIEELGSQAALALSDNYEGQRNGSVRDVPDLRTIRFYTTRGLLDRPAEMRGRTALYGRRHLLQLVAIKRLQARGLTLVEIQQKLLGLTSAALQRIARVPEHLFSGAAERARTAREPDGRREDFWRESSADYAPQEADAAEENAGPRPLQGIPIESGITLLLEAGRELDEEDIEAIRVAAGPLLKLLEKRRLIRPRQERRTS